MGSGRDCARFMMMKITSVNTVGNTVAHPLPRLAHPIIHCWYNILQRKLIMTEQNDDPLLPKKSLFNIVEVAQYFDVTDRTIRLWIEHGHLEKEVIVGVMRIPRESILKCRFNKKILP